MSGRKHEEQLSKITEFLLENTGVSIKYRVKKEYAKVSVKDGSLCPEFATISYADYNSIKEKLMEGMVSVVLEDGYRTKGNGQNLTAFYVETVKE